MTHRPRNRTRRNTTVTHGAREATAAQSSKLRRQGEDGNGHLQVLGVQFLCESCGYINVHGFGNRSVSTGKLSFRGGWKRVVTGVAIEGLYFKCRPPQQKIRQVYSLALLLLLRFLIFFAMHIFFWHSHAALCHPTVSSCCHGLDHAESGFPLRCLRKATDCNHEDSNRAILNVFVLQINNRQQLYMTNGHRTAVSTVSEL